MKKVIFLNKKQLMKLNRKERQDYLSTKKEYSSSELMWRSSATRVGGLSWYNQPTTFKGYGYDNPPQEEKKIIDYIWTAEPKKDPAADYIEGKFPKIDEAIRNAKRGKR